jgi:hypothetical protein
MNLVDCWMFGLVFAHSDSLILWYTRVYVHLSGSTVLHNLVSSKWSSDSKKKNWQGVFSVAVRVRKGFTQGVLVLAEHASNQTHTVWWFRFRQISKLLVWCRSSSSDVFILEFVFSLERILLPVVIDHITRCLYLTLIVSSNETKEIHNSNR